MQHQNIRAWLRDTSRELAVSRPSRQSRSGLLTQRTSVTYHELYIHVHVNSFVLNNNKLTGLCVQCLCSDILGQSFKQDWVSRVVCECRTGDQVFTVRVLLCCIKNTLVTALTRSDRFIYVFLFTYAKIVTYFSYCVNFKFNLNVDEWTVKIAFITYLLFKVVDGLFIKYNGHVISCQASIPSVTVIDVTVQNDSQHH